MPIAMTDEQRAARSSLHEWAAKADRPLHWPDLARLGLFDVTREGGGVVDLAAMLEQTAEDLVPGPVLPTALAGVLLAEHPVGDLLADGRAAVALGLTSGTLTAVGGVLNGEARYVLGAVEASHLILRAGDTWVVVPADRAVVTGLDAVDLACSLGHVALENVSATEVLPDPTDLAMTLFAAEASGVAAWCLRTATAHARQREQFGRPIGSFQAVKHLCVEMLCRAEQASAVAWDAARAADEARDELPLAAAVAASVALDAAVENAKDCIQVLGGIGFTWEHDAHRYLRRALALRQHAGGTAKWRRRAAELALNGARRSLRVELQDDPAEERAAAKAFAAEITALEPAEQRKRLADSGYLVPHWPKPYGLDASPAVQLVIDDELAGVRRPDLVIGAWAAPTILRHGTPEQQERFVRPTLRGEITWCQLFSEPEAGSDLASLRTRAIRTEGGWLLTGQKVWTSLAHQADWAICLARTDPDVPKHKGITYFLVDMRTRGIDVRPLREITGEARFNEVFLDDVFVPDDCVVGDVDNGWRLARTTLANERVAMGRGSSLGEWLERVLELDAARDPDVRERIGALVGEGLAGSVLELRAGLKQLSGADPGAESSVRKLVGVRHRQAVAEFGVELLGLDAVVAHPLVHEFLLGRCLSIAGGTTQVLLNLAGERILGLPREG
ncbi:acyl-CoA dehydrogenase [Lentzea tibetensis]|uniref:Acyl-CoA dehydrogenase n=1 Tax=Lentzea tibetensis TaxID=2591470 RepID=A0A563F2F7_9PSEU|nr:acyl-CoA dehydrogenase [Lentzea tibetensis]TWP54140.1 acyl-CoA dehydrogenase [Lentzea tibetensis]